ncbi:MAG: DEAD/DEAH box helicase [Dehalococcoidia bacterium]
MPEDIAFRPAAEGGDASIVPARRRPAGPRTDRVLYAGIKQYVTRSAEAEAEEADAEADAEPPVAPSPPAVEASEDRDEASTSKRRRGRRGGRRHRRAEDGAADATEASEDDESDGGLDAAGVTDVEHDDRDEAPSKAPALAVDPSTFPPAFRALGLSERSLAAVAGFGFTTPSPIQEQSIPLLLGGRDVVGIAQTGTGKTLAFGLPMVERLDGSRRAVQGLVLVPTRELAQQVLEVLQDLGKPYGLEAVGLLGGRALERDFRALERRPQIVVGTPGRVIDHLHRETLSLSAVRYAVLDEADQMLDIGFLPDITRILTRTPRARQTALFSATMPHSILRLVRRYMEEPETVTIAPEQTTVETVEQVYFEVAQRDKIRGLQELIDRELRGRTLIFSRTRRGVDYLRDQLSDAGIRVGALHGDMDQRKRDQVVQQFREGRLDVLVATNVAARGLDIPEITHVVNYDVPQNPEEYVHRIGRTGRAGRTGKAITFVCERDVAEFDALLAAFGDRLQKEQLELYA